MKKPTRKGLIKKLDTLTSWIIRARDKGCVQAADGKCNGVLTNGHVLAGRYHALRWDIRPNGNCHGQCWGHNSLHVYHQNFYHDWFRKKFGEKRWKEMQLEYYGNRHKFSDLELKQMIEKYTQILKEMLTK